MLLFYLHNEIANSFIGRDKWKVTELDWKLVYTFFISHVVFPFIFFSSTENKNTSWKEEERSISNPE